MSPPGQVPVEGLPGREVEKRTVQSEVQTGVPPGVLLYTGPPCGILRGQAIGLGVATAGPAHNSAIKPRESAGGLHEV